MKEFKVKFRSYFFEAYHLNKFRNCIAPIDCDETDCPKYGTPECDDDVGLEVEELSDMISLAKEYLDSLEYINDAAIFLHCYDESMYAIIKSPLIDDSNVICQSSDGINMTIMRANGFDATFFAEMDADFLLSYYGLLIEQSPNFWKVVTE